MNWATLLDKPADQRYFEDYLEGGIYEFGRATVTEASILAFAHEFDPQPFHNDPETARGGPFGGLIASGWHTISIVWRLVTDHFLSSIAALGSPGIGEVSWPVPTRPGDILRARVTILDTKKSQSRPEKGFVKIRVEAINQKEEVVVTLDGVKLMVATYLARI